MKPSVRVILAEPIETFPDEAERLAADVRQLFRARGAGDEVARWLCVNSICSRLTRILSDLLSSEASWDSDRRWLDSLFRREVVLEHPNCIGVTGPMVWGFTEDAGGPQWAEPFAAELAFQPGFARLASCAIQFADRRVFGEESLRDSIARISSDIESGVIEWKYEFHRSFDSKAEADVSANEADHGLAQDHYI